MEIKFKKAIFPMAVLCLLFADTDALCKTTYIPWKILSKGLAYKKIDLYGAHVGFLHAFQIDPKKLDLDIVTASEYGLLNAPIKTLANKSHALVAINGGFFTPEYKPLGLLIKGGKIINPIKKTSWWGIFGITNNIPRFTKQNEFETGAETQMAIQCGPRLVVNGSVPRLKADLAERSAICETWEGMVVLAVTENAPISTTELAETLRAPPTAGGLDCINALNLDGGGSTQIYAKIKDFELNVMGVGPIINGIGVYQKAHSNTSAVK